VERAKLDTFVQGNDSGVTLTISLSENQEDKFRLMIAKTSKDANLSENQEDKLALLRTLQGVLYTTRDESLTNLLSKYE
jgi:hypothetical protein